MKIYFAGSIRGGRELRDVYMEMIEYMRQYGEVLTEHVGNKYLSDMGEKMSSREIYDRDMTWLSSADVIVADVTVTSLGVGYELGSAVEQKKPILCLYKPEEGKSLSAMIDGSPGVVVRNYQTLDEVKGHIKEFLSVIAIRLGGEAI
ncbi:MAG: nucleoside 2-deoxyribosyltransferase [Candidatus Absconditabacterales bacterium]